MPRDRLKWLDVAKGIGILLTIIGHCTNVEGHLFQYIFTFHRPLFFFLSGFISNHDRPFKQYISKKAKSLMIPFVLFFLLGLITTLILPIWRKGLTVWGLKSDLWLMAPNQVHNSSIWFLACLFFVSVLYWGIRKIDVPYMKTIIFIAVYAMGIWYSKNRFYVFGYDRLPFTLDVVPAAIMFYAIGALVRDGVPLDEYLNQQAWHRLLFLSILLFVVTGFIYEANGYTNIHGLNYGNPVLYILGAMSGTGAVIALSAVISKGEKPPVFCLRQALLWYGKNSLFILGIQSLLIRLYIEFIKVRTGAILQLYRFPNHHAVYSTLLVGLVVCPFFCLLKDLMMKVLVKKRSIYEKNTST